MCAELTGDPKYVIGMLITLSSVRRNVAVLVIPGLDQYLVELGRGMAAEVVPAWQRNANTLPRR